jgi:phage terminase large subunit
MELTPKQTIAIDALERPEVTELLFGGAAGGGKSALGAFWLLFNCFEYPGSRWLMGRSVLKTLKETTLNTFFEVAGREGLQSGVDYTYRENGGTIRFPNGSEILLKDLCTYPSDPNFDGLGSLEITGAFIDECNQISEKAKGIVKSRIRYKLDQFGLRPKLLMTCNPAKNWTYSQFYKPSRDKELPESRAFVQSLVTDNPYISPHYIDSLRTLDTASRMRLLEGSWEYDDDPSALIRYDAIIDLFKNAHVAPGRENYITADIARFGRDSTVIMVWHGYVLKEVVELARNAIDEAAGIIRQLANKHQVPMSRVVVDEDGVGGGVVDILKCKGFVNNSAALATLSAGRLDTRTENYANLKSQCYYLLADRINAAGLYIAADFTTQQRERLIAELEQVKQYNMDKDTRKQVLPKDKVKEVLGRSPDYSDALMMREYFDLRPTLGKIRSRQ